MVDESTLKRRAFEFAFGSGNMNDYSLFQTEARIKEASRARMPPVDIADPDSITACMEYDPKTEQISTYVCDNCKAPDKCPYK